MVMVAFVADFVAMGLFYYSYGAFFLPIAEELGDGSRFGVSLGMALVSGVAALISPLVGYALDRYAIKWIMASGAVVIAVGFALMSVITSLWEFYAVSIACLGVGTALMGEFATAKLVANWFARNRGIALGIATLSVSLAGVVVPPGTTWLITEYGWRGSFAIFSVVTVIVILPPVLLLVVNTPREKHLSPAGRAFLPAASTDQPCSAVDVSWQALLSSPVFWGVVVSIGLLFCEMGAIFTIMIPFARDLGFGAFEAAYIFSASAIPGIFGRVFFGLLADQINARLAIIVIHLTQLTGIILMLNASQFSSLVIAAGIIGFGMGGVGPLYAMIVSTFFGPKQFGKVMGLMRPTMLPLQVSGYPLTGWVFDHFGSYDLALHLFIVLLIVALFATWSLIPRK